MTTNRSLRVFLCHSSADKRAVRDLYKKLVDRGIDVWFDEKKLLGGQKWKMEIPKAVRNSDVVIICLSKTSITKEGYVQAEIKFALDVALEKPEGTIFLIPTRLEECEVPNNLREWHWVNLFDFQGFESLIESLKARASSLGLKIKDIEEIEGELIMKAIVILRNNQRASVSLLQRRLKINYTNSIRLLDQLEAMGVVGPAGGITPSREVLIGKDRFVEEDEF